MKKILIMILCVTFLLGCARWSFNKDISNGLQPASLRSSFNTQPVNFKDLSKCTTADVLVNIVNVEKNNSDTNIVWGSMVGWSINPQIMTDQIIAYMENSYKQCRVFTNKTSPKTIQVSIKSIEGFPNGAFKFTSNAVLKLNVSIPEKNYTETFTANQSTGDLYMAVVYAIHDITWQIINDPVIQDYIVCR